MYGRQNDNREIEPGLQALLGYATAPLVANVRRQVYKELDSVLLEKVHWSPEENRVVDPEELMTYVHNCRINLETSLLEEISAYPATRWLYYLRALPEFAFGLGGHIGSDVYRVNLAEALTGRIKTHSEDDPLRYPLHEPVLKQSSPIFTSNCLPRRLSYCFAPFCKGGSVRLWASRSAGSEDELGAEQRVGAVRQTYPIRPISANKSGHSGAYGAHG